MCGQKEWQDSKVWWWLYDLWYIGELKFYFQTPHYIGAGDLSSSGGKTLHEITWFYKDKINLIPGTFQLKLPASSHIFLHSWERPSPNKKAFLPFTESWLAKIYHKL